MKKIKLAVLALLSVASLASCNKQVIDLQYQYNYAYVMVGDTYLIQGPVDSWTDYADGDQIQVTINGTTYLVHSDNVTLIYNPSLTFAECRRCGFNYSSEFDRCPYCGSVEVETTQEVVQYSCPECGYTFDYDYDVCPNCNAYIGD